MTNYIMAVYSNAKPGRDAAYMEWYQSVHLPQILTVAGIKSGRMYGAMPASPSKPAATYLAIFELEVDDPATVLQEILRRGATGEMQSNDFVDPASVQFTFFKQKF